VVKQLLNRIKPFLSVVKLFFDLVKQFEMVQNIFDEKSNNIVIVLTNCVKFYLVLSNKNENNK
jgi:hypothetical protein